MTKKLTTITIIILLASAICYAERIGSASYYGIGDGFGGQRTSDGSRMNPNAFTCASWHYPLGTKLEVIYRHKFYAWSSRHGKRVKCIVDKKVIVKVNDRGGLQLLDLSAGAFKKLAPLSRGIINVRVRRVK